MIQHQTHILDIIYISDPKYQVILTSSHDSYVRGWKATTSGFVLAPQP